MIPRSITMRIGFASGILATVSGFAGAAAPAGRTACTIAALIAGVVTCLVIVLLTRRWIDMPRAPSTTDAADPLSALAAALAAALAEIARLELKIEQLDNATAVLRHDLRGILSPALLTADRLLSVEDPIAQRAATTTIRAVERVNARLAETKAHAPPDAGRA